MFLGLKMKWLDRQISKQFKHFGIKCRYADDFAYFYYKKIVSYSIQEDITNKWYMDFVEKTFKYKPINCFVFSFLHEIGHHFTMDDIDCEIDAFCQEEKARIDEEIKNANVYQRRGLSMKYYALPDEYIATKWAVEYEKNHREEVKKIWKNIELILYMYYKMNGLL